MIAQPQRRTLAALKDRPEEALEDRSDDDLMLLARGGLEAAFEVLIKRHQTRALRIAVRYVGDLAQAKDVVQCAFLDLFRNAQRYQCRGKFSAYLWRIVINQCHAWARASRTAQLSSSLPLIAERKELDSLLRRERGRDLEEALGKLSEKLRVVVVLRYGADLDLAEIAETLDLPLGTVKRRLFDAMAKLRELLHGEP